MNNVSEYKAVDENIFIDTGSPHLVIRKNKLNDMAAESMRILLPSNMNQDSTWTFIMFADPFYEGALYNIGPPLNQKYGEKGAKEVFARWSSCFASGQVIFPGKQR